MWDLLLVNGRFATFRAAVPYDLADFDVCGIEGERIVWLGSGTPPERVRTTVDLGGRLATPGIVDPHTHLVFGGDRANEFEERLKGATYAQIAQRGGGILSTVRATRAASEDELFARALPRLERLLADGATTVEIKSGYGLNLESERRMLCVARQLGEKSGARVITTFLGLHALPTEFAGNADGYVALVCDEIMPALVREGLVDAADAFCENIAFTPAQTARYFERARELGIPVKLHADQLTDCGGAALAATHQALSADHLEHTSADGIAALAKAGTVATLLPGAFYVLRETALPPIAALREANVPIAIATDANPGTSPLFSPLLAANFACTLFRLTPEEALMGLTRNAARALGLGDELGTLEIGKRADIAIWNAPAPVNLIYPLGALPLAASLRDGKPLRDPGGVFV